MLAGESVDGRVQISGGKLSAYLQSIRAVWGDDVDYERIVRHCHVGDLQDRESGDREKRG